MLPLLFLFQLFVFAFSVEEKIEPQKSFVAGGITPQKADAPEHLEKAWKAIKKLNEEANEGENLMVKKAESQVVAGIRYIYEVLYGESTCKKSDASNDVSATKANCKPKEGGKKALYKVDLWEKPWQNFEQFTITKIQDVA
ncbi:unnamed protein product [Cylicocyclus nassatus]|uniref:Cystatin domain-containing protein n=1 Tax=Cylicocyclus nassatus TaxID=53992 RepID=A0AA36MAF4_CYLNA|nr:unnamed protein product [Cylicocyclus nassatus]